MAKAFQSRGHGRGEKTFRTGTQAYNGLLEQGYCPSCDRTRQTERGKEASGSTFKRFLSTLTQDISE